MQGGHAFDHVFTGVWRSLTTPFSQLVKVVGAVVVPVVTRVSPVLPAAVATTFKQMGQVVIMKEPEGLHNMDVVFFHGLQLSSGEDAFYSSWVNDEDTCWPLLWLPQDFPGARVMSVKYDAGAVQHPGQQGVKDLASSILADLIHAGAGKQRGTQKSVPLVLVGHSLGGVVLKEVCNQARDGSQSDDDKKRFLGSISTVAFLSTPHAGADLARLGSAVLPPAQLLLQLMPFDRDMAESSVDFRELCSRNPSWNVFQLHETVPMKGIMVVTPASGMAALSDVSRFHLVPGVDHVTIAKPRKNTDSFYLTFKREVRKVAYQWVDVNNHQIPSFVRSHACDSAAPEGDGLFVARMRHKTDCTPGTTGRHCKGMTYELGNKPLEGYDYQVLHTPHFDLFFEWRNMADMPDARAWAAWHLAATRQERADNWKNGYRRWLEDAFDASDFDSGYYIVRSTSVPGAALVTDGFFGKIYHAFPGVGSFALREGPCRCCSDLHTYTRPWNELQVLCYKKATPEGRG